MRIVLVDDNRHRLIFYLWNFQRTLDAIVIFKLSILAFWFLLNQLLISFAIFESRNWIQIRAKKIKSNLCVWKLYTVISMFIRYSWVKSTTNTYNDLFIQKANFFIFKSWLFSLMVWIFHPRSRLLYEKVVICMKNPTFGRTSHAWRVSDVSNKYIDTSVCIWMEFYISKSYFNCMSECE